MFVEIDFFLTFIPGLHTIDCYFITDPSRCFVVLESVLNDHTSLFVYMLHGFFYYLILVYYILIFLI